MALISPPTTMPFTVPSWHPLLAYVRSTFQMLAPCSVALLLQGQKMKVPRFLHANYVSALLLFLETKKVLLRQV
jgi:hypothetical protein